MIVKRAALRCQSLRKRFGLILVVVTGIGLQSCGVNYHLKRAIAKDPTIVSDTIVRVDTTVVTNEVQVVDTLIVRDTIVREIEKNGVVVRVQRIHDTIIVDATCPPDTIKIEKTIPVDRIIYKTAEREVSIWDKMLNVLWSLAAVVVLLIVLRMFR